MKPVTVYFEPAQLEALTKLSRLTRVPKAVYVRDALDAFLAGVAQGDVAKGAKGRLVAAFGYDPFRVVVQRKGEAKFYRYESMGLAKGRKR